MGANFNLYCPRRINLKLEKEKEKVMEVNSAQTQLKLILCICTLIWKQDKKKKKHNNKRSTYTHKNLFLSVLWDILFDSDEKNLFLSVLSFFILKLQTLLPLPIMCISRTMFLMNNVSCLICYLTWFYFVRTFLVKVINFV